MLEQKPLVLYWIGRFLCCRNQVYTNSIMKNIPLKYAIAIAGVIIILIGVIVWQGSNKGSEPQVSSAPEQVQDQAPAKVTVATKPTAPVVKTAPVAPVKTNPNTSYTSYTEYVKQLGAAQNACDNATASQYKQLYSNLMGSGYKSYYNPTSGSCYGRINGSITPAYATTSVGYIYFRNINKNTLVAECTDPTGVLFADSNWKCTNKGTGAAISKPQFEALVAGYIAQ